MPADRFFRGSTFRQVAGPDFLSQCMLKLPSIRQLLGQCYGRWQDDLARTMGYSRTRRLRSPAPALVPSDGCVSNLLFARQPA